MAARNNATLEEIRVTDKFREYIGEKKTLKPGSIQVESYNINKLQSFIDIFSYI